jgi:hypothetical protein
MIRAVIYAVLAASLALSTAYPESLPGSSSASDVEQIMAVGKGTSRPLFHADQRVVSQQCCKVCHTGQACGNTCISRQDVCHVGRGCACDG